MSYDGKGPNIQRLAKIAAVTERRGPHAFGFSWLDWRGRLQMFKRPGRITQHLSMLDVLKNARIVVGHCRFATHGSPDNNLNNHPHPADAGWIVHNGVVTNHEEIAAEHDLWPISSCDSEVLGLLVAASSGPIRKRCARAVDASKGILTMLGVWSRPARMVAIRRGNPLSVGELDDGNRFYLGSLPDGLPGTVTEMPDNSGMEFTPQTVTSFDVDKPNPPPFYRPHRTSFDLEGFIARTREFEQ